MQQHVLDDAIGTLAVLHDLLEIAAQHVRQLVDLLARLVVDRQALHDALQLVDQLARDGREIVDKIERVFDLVSDAGGELTERGELLRLDEAVLRGAQILQRCGQLARTSLHAFEQTNILNRNRRLVSKCCNQLNLLVSEWPDFGTCQRQNADWSAFAQHRNTKIVR